MAKEMVRNGLLYRVQNRQYQINNFPSRNRIVAGMSDATVVVETDMGGSRSRQNWQTVITRMYLLFRQDN